MTADRNSVSVSSEKIFDCHGHIGPCKKFYSADDGSVESMIEVMDASGIERIVVSSMLSLYYDISVGNREMIEAVERFPGRILGYIAVSQRMGEAAVAELDRYRDTPGVVGVKIHPWLHETRPEDPGYEPVYRWCVENSFPILSHVWGTRDVDDFRSILSRYPDLKVILGHSGGPFRDALVSSCRLANDFSDVYLDITCSRTLAGLIEFLVEQAPAERVLFGSDTPFIDPAPAIGLVKYARVSEEIRDAILRGNALKLFGDRTP